MHDLLPQLRSHRQTLFDDAEAVLAAAEDRGRTTLLDVDNRRYRALLADIENVDHRIAEVSNENERRARAAVTLAELGLDTRPQRKTHAMTTKTSTDQFRALAAGDIRSLDIDLGERRDLSIGTATAGGNTVPTSMVATLYEHLIDVAALRRTNVSTFTTASGEDLLVPTTTAHSTAAYVAEAGTIGESDPAFGSVTLGAHKAGFIVDVSSELLADSAVNLSDYLARMAGEAIGNLFGESYINGTAGTEPEGLLPAAVVGKTGGTGVTGLFTGDDVIDLYHSLPERYRRSAEWLCSSGAVGELRKLEDANGGKLWGDLRDGSPPTLMGRPVIIDENMPDPALDARSLMVADFSRAYAVRDVATVRVERSNDVRWESDQVSFRFLYRGDGKVLHAGAARVFVGGAS